MASPSPLKPDFWRIRSIETSERGVAAEWLAAEVKELDITDGQGFSLAADSERTLCATLTSLKRPEPPNRRWRVDKDFIGVTPLSEGEEEDIDIVAIPGLGGHALESFQSPEGLAVWLRDFAPRDITRARFLVYGYDSTVGASDSNQGVRELARTLLDGLAGFRSRTSTQQRPICFIGHSLGGVILKEALVLAESATEPRHHELYNVMLTTHGMVLMGVPNLGMMHTGLATAVAGRPNENFISDLLARTDGEPSQLLAHLTEEFARLCRRQQLPWRIVSYYETKRSPTIAVSPKPLLSFVSSAVLLTRHV